MSRINPTTIYEKLRTVDSKLAEQFKKENVIQSIKIVKAKKDWKCTSCKTSIKANEKYQRIILNTAFGFKTEQYCVACATKQDEPEKKIETKKRKTNKFAFIESI